MKTKRPRKTTGYRVNERDTVPQDRPAPRDSQDLGLAATRVRCRGGYRIIRKKI